MAEKLSRIDAILEEVEKRGFNVLSTFNNNSEFNLLPGALPVQPDALGRPDFIYDLDGQPIWWDIFIAPENQPNKGAGLNLDYCEYFLEYEVFRREFLEAQINLTKLDFEFLLFGLIISTLLRDFHLSNQVMADVVRYLNGQEISDASPQQVFALLGRGNSRVRAILGRVLASVTESSVLSRLLEFFEEEVTDSVRVEIIIEIVRHQGLRRLPEITIQNWLAHPKLAIPLALVVAAYRHSLPLTDKHLSQIRPEYQSFIKPWFQPLFVDSQKVPS